MSHTDWPKSNETIICNIVNKIGFEEQPSMGEIGPISERDTKKGEKEEECSSKSLVTCQYHYAMHLKLFSIHQYIHPIKCLLIPSINGPSR